MFAPALKRDAGGNREKATVYNTSTNTSTNTTKRPHSHRRLTLLPGVSKVSASMIYGGAIALSPNPER